jgi:hypothetical protein
MQHRAMVSGNFKQYRRLTALQLQARSDRGHVLGSRFIEVLDRSIERTFKSKAGRGKSKGAIFSPALRKAACHPGGGGDRPKMEDQPHAKRVAHAPQQPM